MPRKTRVVTACAAGFLLSTLAAVAPAAAFWDEDFNNGCDLLCPGDGYTGVNGTWTVTDVSAPGMAANIWYVSCAENGENVGDCGRGCSGDATLHVGNVSTSPAAFIFCPTGDCGAAYDASGATVVANKRIESPLIDATGQATLSVTLAYIGAGQACNDSADLVYSFDGGLSWEVIAACLRSVNSGCSGQGRWTELTAPLPASADNNPVIKIGFHWRNNGDFVGADPSFAVDDISLKSSSGCPPQPPPITDDIGNNLLAIKLAPDAHLDWSGMGAPAPSTTHFHPYRWTSPRDPLMSWDLLGSDLPPLVVQVWDDPVVADPESYYYNIRSANDCEAISTAR